MLLKSEVYKIKNSRYLYVGFMLALFFSFALSVNYQYEYIRKPQLHGVKVYQDVYSLDFFTQYLFQDYSMFYPFIYIMSSYFSDDFHYKVYSVIHSNGISKARMILNKMIAGWIITLIYMCINIIVSDLLFIRLLPNDHIKVNSFSALIIYLSLQYVGYSFLCSIILLLSIIFRRKQISFAITIFLLVLCYLYLPKLSGALDFDFSLYVYWVVGFSINMEINDLASAVKQMPVILLEFALVIYSTCFLFLHFDLERE